MRVTRTTKGSAVKVGPGVYNATPFRSSRKPKTYGFYKERNARLLTGPCVVQVYK